TAGPMAMVSSTGSWSGSSRPRPRPTRKVQAHSMSRGLRTPRPGRRAGALSRSESCVLRRWVAAGYYELELSVVVFSLGGCREGGVGAVERFDDADQDRRYIGDRPVEAGLERDDRLGEGRIDRPDDPPTAVRQHDPDRPAVGGIRDTLCVAAPEHRGQGRVQRR